MESPQPQIVVSRPSGQYRDVLRRYRIRVDGTAAGTIGRGEELIIPAEPGPHEVQARIDWTGSPKVEVTVGPDNPARLVVRPAGGALAIFRVLSRTRYLILESV